MLALLAADSDAFVKLEIMAHHADVFESLGSVADERGAADGPGELSVFDQVALRSGEDEIAAGDIHLASAESGAVDPFRHAADNFFGIAISREHIGIGHARH